MVYAMLSEGENFDQASVTAKFSTYDLTSDY